MTKHKALLMTIAAIGGILAANAFLKPSPHHSIKASMDSQLHSYNSHMKPQDPRNTIFDRTGNINGKKGERSKNME